MAAARASMMLQIAAITPRAHPRGRASWRELPPRLANQNVNQSVPPTSAGSKGHRKAQCAQLPVLYTFMVRWKEYRKKALTTGAPWPLADSIAEVYEQFKTVAAKKNVTRLNEHTAGFESLEKRIKNDTNQKSAG